MCQNYNAVSNTILQELDKINDVEMNEGICTPIPNYLYIQRYGRRAQEQMDKILLKIGKKTGFYLRWKSNYVREGLSKILVWNYIDTLIPVKNLQAAH